MEKEDQQWLDTLAGQASDLSNTPSQIEAASVRRALISRRIQIERDASNFDVKGYQKAEITLKRSGFLTETNTKKRRWLIGSILSTTQSSGAASSRASAVKIHYLLIIATTILIAGLVINSFYFERLTDDTIRFRGDESITYIITKDAQKKKIQFISGLEEIKAEFTLEDQSFGKTKIQIKPTDAVREFLHQKGIREFTAVNDQITIVISPRHVGNK